jgi:S1-C subfamily serine protease
MMQFAQFRTLLRVRLGGLALFAAFLTLTACAADKTGALKRPGRTGAPRPDPESNTVEALTASARESIVVVTQFGREQKEEGVGAGFVISEDGLVATSLHVIGEGRPIRVRLAGGRLVEATEVFASDRNLDSRDHSRRRRKTPAVASGRFRQIEARRLCCRHWQSAWA